LIDHGEEMNVCLVGHDPTSGQDLEPTFVNQLLQAFALNLKTN
jgi:hypothetical protein